MKKHITLLLVAAMLLSAFTACGQTAEQETAAVQETAAAETVETETELTAELPDVFYDGYTYTILTMKDYSARYHLTAEEMSGEPLNDATYDRNAKIQERLGVEIATHENDGVAAVLRNAVSAGDTTFDMVLPHPNANAGLTAMVSGGLLFNLYELPVADWDKPWWNQSALEALSIGDTAFLTVGDYAVTCQGVGALVFNKDLQADLGITEDLYDMVWEGTWTADSMYSMMEIGTSDLNGDGKMDGTDCWGLLNNGFSHSWQFAMGQKFTEKDADGFPRVVMNTDRMYSIVETCYNMLTAGFCYSSSYSYASFADSEFRKIMMEGRALFSALDIGGLYAQLRDIEFDFGILPYPKLDEEQEDYMTFCGAGISGVPVNLTDAERTGTVMEAMAYYSYEYQVPAFFDIVLENKAVRDEESYDMITLLHQTKTFDFGFNLDPSDKVFNMLLTVVETRKSTDFASYYASVESAIEKKFEEFYQNFKQ